MTRDGHYPQQLRGLGIRKQPVACSTVPCTLAPPFDPEYSKRKELGLEHKKGELKKQGKHIQYTLQLCWRSAKISTNNMKES